MAESSEKSWKIVKRLKNAEKVTKTDVRTKISQRWKNRESLENVASVSRSEFHNENYF